MNAQQLRNSILQEAIEGRLVPQDSNDEPASALLERIREEKKRLVKEGKLKKKDLEETPISEDEKPFEIPESWEWVRLGNVAEIARGGSPRPIKEYITEDSNGLNWIKIGDTDKGGKYINSCKEKIKLEGLKKTRIVHPGDFLLTNSMSFGRPYITNIEGCIHDGWLMISPFAGAFEQSYLYYVLSSAFAHKQFNDKVAGAVVQNLNSDKVAESLIPLPPLAEQKRIVAKIEELLPKVEEYGKAQDALNKLNEELPEKLKKSVLQEAITGKLVPQDPNDEPASVLLNRIREEKKRLVKEGKLKKKDLEESPISEDEIPFAIPDSWEWCKLGWIGDWGAGATPAKGNPDFYNNGTIPWLRTGELNNGFVYDSEIKITPNALEKCSLRMCEVGDVLIAMYGATIGKVAIAGIKLTTNQACCACTPLFVYNKYLMYYLMASKKTFTEMGEGGAQPNISREKIVAFPFALPPLAEQHRIVEKLEQLLGEIDKLKK